MTESFTRQLTDVFTLDDLSSVMEHKVKSYGFSGFLYWTHLHKPIPELDANDCFIVSRGPSYLKAFEILYFNKKLYQDDPVVHIATERHEPFCTAEIRKMSPPKPKGKRIRLLYDIEKRFGFHQDIYIPVHTPFRTQVFYAYFLGDNPANQQLINQILPELQLQVTQFVASIADFIILGGDDETVDLLLSKREQECLMWMAKGRSNNDIAQILELSERTIKFHVKNILLKLNASNRTEAVAIAARTGWIIN